MHYLEVAKYSDLDDPKERKTYRLLEIFPGLLAWATLGFVFLGSFLWPVFMAVFIITFDVYWLIKTGFLALHLNASFKKVRKNMKMEWLKELEKSGLDWTKMYHLVVLPFYKEDEKLVRHTLEAIKNSNYPKDKFIVVLAGEERAGEHAISICRQMEQDYKDVFFKFIYTIHPKDIAGDLPGKGSNIHYAGKKVKDEIIDVLKIPYENILVSAFDVDTVAGKEYFGILTHKFLTTPNNLHASYQPIPMYINNIYEAPSFARVVAFSATFFHMLQQERQERLITFSSHSMPFKALVDVGFWQRNMVSEDSRIFWQCFLRYDGNYRAESLYYTVNMDSNVAPTLWQTMKNVYKQQRRWAWGIENIPYFLFGFLKRGKHIPRFRKWYLGFSVTEGHWSWSTNSLIVFLLGWLPVIVGGPEFNKAVLSFNLPFITRNLITIGMISIVSEAFLSFLFLPPRPPNYGRFKTLWLALQWVLLPITLNLFGAIPALEAQTRLMVKKYLGFWVTPKYRRQT